jgi:hypothetical protein
MTQRANTVARKPLNSTPAGIGQWSLGATFVVVGVVGTLISASYNWKFGVAFGGATAGGILLLSDILKGLTPFTAKVTGGWKPSYAALYAAMLAASLLCAGSHYLQDLETEFALAERASKSIADADADQTAARADLAKIGELGDVAALTSQVEAAKATAEAALKVAKGLKLECTQNRRCREAAAARDALTERLGNAKRRDSLSASLASARDKGEAVEVKKTVGASLARLTGWDEGTVARWIAVAIMVLSLVTLEASVIVGGWGGAILRDAWDRRPLNTATPAPAPQQVEAVDAAAVIAAEQSGKLTQEACLLRMQMRILSCPGRQLVGSKNAIADEYGVPRSTFKGWCRNWEEAGQIVTKDYGNNSTLFTAPARAAA